MSDTFTALELQILEAVKKHNENFDEELGVSELSQYDFAKAIPQSEPYGRYSIISDACGDLHEKGLLLRTPENEEAYYWHHDCAPNYIVEYNKELR